MRTLYEAYRNRKFEDGGSMAKTMNGISSLGAGVFSTLGNMADAADTGNKYGTQSAGTHVLKNVGTFASMGSAFGPIGTAVGAGVGVVKGIVDARKAEKDERTARMIEADGKRQQAMKRYQAMAIADPNVAQGTVGGGFFAGGGSIKGGEGSLYTEFIKKRVKGGSLQRLSSDTVEVKGPSHENGGVSLPGGNEVEGKETIKGDYVLSERLGFAQMHKPIAKAIGKLEQKAATAPTLNSLKRLRQKEEALILLQEHVKQNMNHGS